MVSEDEKETTYQPKDAVSTAIESTLITGGAGLAVSAIQNTLTKQNVAGWGIFTRTGGVIAIFGSLSSVNRLYRNHTKQRYSCCRRDLWILEIGSRKFTGEE